MKEVNNSWLSYSPTELIFGTGEFSNTHLHISKYNSKRVLIVYGSSSKLHGRVDSLKSNFNKRKIQVHLGPQINGEPNTSDVINIIEKINKHNIDLIIAIGGGSVIDAGKAASVIALNSYRIEDMFEGKQQSGPNKVNLIAIPTTAGTGAELSFGSIINSIEKKKKFGIRGHLVAPEMAIIDPSLTLTCSKKQIAISGFDIFTHAVETMISKKATPITTLFSREAISIVPYNLILAINESDRIEPRVKLSYFSMLMGYNLANSSTCLPHRLQYPLGALTNTPHAVGLASLYRAWVRITNKNSREKFDWISKTLSDILKIKDLGIEHSISIFLDKLELNIKLSDFSLNEKDCSTMAKNVSGSLDNDPWWNDGQDLKTFYLDSL